MLEHKKTYSRHITGKTFIPVCLLILSIFLIGCGGSSSQNIVTATPTPVNNQTASENALEAYVSAAENCISSADDMVKRSLTNTGNSARIRKVLEKLSNGEDVTVAYIGGSITEGYKVNSGQEYASKVTAYLKNTFNNNNITSINAGLSGTSSTIGMLRAENDVLVYEPDMVVVEFAVNDSQQIIDKMMYESLVKACLSLESEPAVIVLITMTETGYSCETQMTVVGEAYELPVISVPAAIKPELAAGNMVWTDYSGDEVHPNDAGHTVITSFFEYYFSNMIIADNDTAVDYSDTSIKALGSPYANMNYYDNQNLYIAETGGFSEGSTAVEHFPNGWVWNKGETASLKFTMYGRNLFMLYREKNSDKFGEMEIYIDGKLVKTVNTYASDAWDNPEVVTLLNGATDEEHEIEICVPSDSIDKIIRICAFGTTGEIYNSERPTEVVIPYVERAILNNGNTSRIQDVMARAEAGEKLTIGFIGGSITMGSGASSSSKCYAKLVYDWWCSTYPQAEFTFVNAGIGATTSQFACARLESDLMSYEPDFVIVEFSVNDESTSAYKDSYESLIRMILTDESEPALLVLNMVQYDNGYSVQAMHDSIAVSYDLPIISMKESIFAEITAGRLKASDVSADNLHPNDTGHQYAAEIVTYFLGLVGNGTVHSDSAYVVPDTLSELTYINAVRYDNRNTNAILEGFTTDNTAQSTITDVFKNGYSAADEGSSITFNITGSSFAIQYKKTNLLNSPKAIVIIDGDEANAVEIDGNYPNGWGDWLYMQNIYSDAAGTSSEHTIKIVITEGASRPLYIVSIIAR